MEEKYKTLVNYLKLLFEKSTVYIDKSDVELILKALEELDNE